MLLDAEYLLQHGNTTYISAPASGIEYSIIETRPAPRYDGPCLGNTFCFCLGSVVVVSPLYGAHP